jgi:hypothetical protein
MAKPLPLLPMNKTLDARNVLLSQASPLGARAIELGFANYADLCAHIASMPYARNKHRAMVDGVMIDNQGTCSSKHRYLAAVAEEHAQLNDTSFAVWGEIKLFIGVFEMNVINTPAISDILKRYDLVAIPEAHCYLKWHGDVMDHTSSRFNIPFTETLLQEMEVRAATLYDIKDALHKQVITTWRIDHAVHLSAETIWSAREACIQALSR